MGIGKSGRLILRRSETRVLPAFANIFRQAPQGKTKEETKFVPLLSYLTFMSKEEIKQEITKTLDQFSEKALMDLLSFLKQFQSEPSLSLFSDDHFERLLIEDKELLEKLAQ